MTLRRTLRLGLGLAAVLSLVALDLVMASRRKPATPLAVDALTAATPLESSAVAVVRSVAVGVEVPVAVAVAVAVSVGVGV